MMKISESKNEKEITLLELIAAVKTEKRVIILSTIISTVIGAIVALLISNSYTSSATFIPTSTESLKIGGNLGGLASLAGINMGGSSGGSEIPPSLYPKIANSLDFQLNLLDESIYLYKDSEYSLTYGQYLDSLESKGLLKRVMSLFNSTNNEFERDTGRIISISDKDFDLVQSLRDQLSVLPNDKEGFVSLSITTKNSFVSAQLAQMAVELLQKRLIEFKVKSAQLQLNFIETRYLEIEEEFFKAQEALAAFRDKNQNLSSAFAMNEQERLDAQYSLIYDVYRELAKQLEQAKIQVSKDTPVFSVIEQVAIPNEKSSPRRAIIVGGFFFIGLFFSLSFITIRRII